MADHTYAINEIVGTTNRDVAHYRVTFELGLRLEDNDQVNESEES
jgi:flavin-binding protein dodecin